MRLLLIGGNTAARCQHWIVCVLQPARGMQLTWVICTYVTWALNLVLWMRALYSRFIRCHKHMAVKSCIWFIVTRVKKLDSERDRFVYVPSNEITNAALRNAAHTPKQAFFTFKMSRGFTSNLMSVAATTKVEDFWRHLLHRILSLRTEFVENTTTDKLWLSMNRVSWNFQFPWAWPKQLV